MQSSYAIGEAIAALVVDVRVAARLDGARFFLSACCRRFSFSGFKPRVPEPELWRNADCAATKGALGNAAGERSLAQRNPGHGDECLHDVRLLGIVLLGARVFVSVRQRKAGGGSVMVKTTSFYLVMCFGKWLGYAMFGFFSDAYGRRKPYFLYLMIAAALVPIYGMSRSAFWLLVLGPFVAFFGTGYFSGYAAIVSELFPGEIRATAMGLSYNIGRGISAVAPFAVGALALRYRDRTGFLPAGGGVLDGGAAGAGSAGNARTDVGLIRWTD